MNVDDLKLTAAEWSTPIVGSNLTHDSFEDELGSDQTVVVFLRHLG